MPRESKTAPKGKTFDCLSCGLYATCTSSRMKPYGNFKRQILVVGAAPSQADDKLNLPFQGRAGKLLQRALKKQAVDLFEDCLSTFAVRCLPPDDKAPTNFQLDCCRVKLLKTIAEYKPKVVIALGMEAVYALIGDRWKRDIGTITKWRGWRIPDQDLRTFICPTFSAEFVDENDEGAEETIWMQDISGAISLIREDANTKYKFPIYKEPEIEVIEDLSVLSEIEEEFAFDFETTGIRPNAEGHKIISCSIADTVDHAYVFLMPQTRRELLPLLTLLKNESIGKIAQNCKFEVTWAEVRLGIEVKGWVWDTMLATHVLDNRADITGLKFQTYVQLGVIDYSSEVEPYLKAVNNDSANAINRIEELFTIKGGIEMLLKYNAYDSINELRISKIQREIICLPF